jgi:hypothetical protein
MNKPLRISVNQFATFMIASEKGKKSIVKQQLKPNPLLIPWYQSAKGSIKRYLANVKDTKPLIEGIDVISKKTPENKRQRSDKAVSIEALTKLIELKIAKHFKGIKYSLVKAQIKTVHIDGVEVSISPEGIFKIEMEGRIFWGAVKVHISKTKPFKSEQCRCVANLVFAYLKNNYAKRGETILPELCLCIDIFSERVVPALENDTITTKQIRSVCEELKKLWPK